MKAPWGVDELIWELKLLVVNEHILVDIVDNRDGGYNEDAPRIINLVRMEVDDYIRADGEPFDAEAYEESKSTIFFRPCRRFWEVAYWVARILQRPGQLGAAVESAGGSLLIPSHSITVLS